MDALVWQLACVWSFLDQAAYMHRFCPLWLYSGQQCPQIVMIACTGGCESWHMVSCLTRPYWWTLDGQPSIVVLRSRSCPQLWQMACGHFLTRQHLHRFCPLWLCFRCTGWCDSWRMVIWLTRLYRLTGNVYRLCPLWLHFERGVVRRFGWRHIDLCDSWWCTHLFDQCDSWWRTHLFDQ